MHIPISYKMKGVKIKSKHAHSFIRFIYFLYKMLRFRNKLKPKSKLIRLLVIQPKLFEELPVEVIEKVLSFMNFSDRQSFRQLSRLFREIHDNFLDHRVQTMFRVAEPRPISFLEEFCKIIYENTRLFHCISFPQFLNVFLCHRDLMSIRSLHSTIISKICNAKFIGDVSDVFEKMFLQYLAVVQSVRGFGKHTYRLLLILTLIGLLNASR